MGELDEGGRASGRPSHIPSGRQAGMAVTLRQLLSLGRCFHGLWMLMQKKMLPQIRRKDRD